MPPICLGSRDLSKFADWPLQRPDAAPMFFANVAIVGVAAALAKSFWLNEFEHPSDRVFTTAERDEQRVSTRPR